VRYEHAHAHAAHAHALARKDTDAQTVFVRMFPRERVLARSHEQERVRAHTN